MNPIGLYIHVPFCDGKCPYCNFYSVNANSLMMDGYTDEVCKRIVYFGKELSRTADTLYFGGGTPSLLGANRLAKIVDVARDMFELKNSEITVEVNPSKGKNLDFQTLRNSGVNRLSIGLQSANNQELSLLGRKHSEEDIVRTLEFARESGFENISLDLMLAIQGQTKESLEASIKFCSDNNVQHVSAYLLKIEEGTPYYEKRDEFNFPDDELQSDLYLFACEKLEELGFSQYEISNFSLPGRESKHNLKYWNCEEYLGIGPSAHSFVDGKRFYYEPSIKSFMDGGGTIYDDVGGNEEEYIMLRLRLVQGLQNVQFIKKYGCSIPKKYYERASKYERYGLVICDREGIKFTREGFLISNELIAKIILGDN